MSSNQQKTVKALESLLHFSDEASKLNLEAELLHLKFVSVIEELMEKERMSRTELAERLGTSNGYITQLFTGDKLFNIKTLAKLQQALDLNFKIEAERKRPNFVMVNNSRFKRRFTADFVKRKGKDSKYQAGEPQRTLVA